MAHNSSSHVLRPRILSKDPIFPRPHHLLTKYSCSGKHVVFGEVIKGKSLAREVERHPTSSGDNPTVPIIISHCGELMDGEDDGVTPSGLAGGRE
jgi:cyclophilin family peptidyl-prolyl cis-trans isomerase